MLVVSAGPIVQRYDSLDSTAASYLAEVEQRGYDSADENSRIVSGLTVVGGWGWSTRPRTIVSIATSKSQLTVSTGKATRIEELDWPDVDLVDVHGEALQTGGGFSGGGFGVAGAVQGMIAAEVLNHLTTETRVNTLVHVGSRTGEMVAHNHSMPDAMRFLFGPAIAAIAGSHVEPPGDSLSRIERLAALVDTGHLTDAEFQQFKSRILDSD